MCPGWLAGWLAEESSLFHGGGLMCVAHETMRGLGEPLSHPLCGAGCTSFACWPPSLRAVFPPFHALHDNINIRDAITANSATLCHLSLSERRTLAVKDIIQYLLFHLPTRTRNSEYARSTQSLLIRGLVWRMCVQDHAHLYILKHLVLPPSVATNRSGADNNHAPL
jgi:hypothetical protein